MRIKPRYGKFLTTWTDYNICNKIGLHGKLNEVQIKMNCTRKMARWIKKNATFFKELYLTSSDFELN